ncbi:hypothetical protein C8Q79DRAFT_369735 [Trametes meyenii]|nr:hypothetical protein C8Q79DRAFT_369735 [Trametes meyenii]
MSLSGQLPLTAFYKSASSQSRSTKPSVSKSALKRRDALARAQDATSSKKRQRHKENRDFAARGSLQSLNDRSDKQSGSLHDGKADPPHPAASIVRHEDIIDLTDTTAPAIKAPSTPIVHTGDRRLITAASLPSPPLTASDAKRIRGPRDGTDTARCLHTPDPHLNDPSLASATDAVAVGHKDSIVLFPPHKGGKTSMPPPPLPLKASSFSMPSRRTFRSPPSRSSDDWVPSSQPHETSIPRPERSNDDRS